MIPIKNKKKTLEMTIDEMLSTFPTAKSNRKLDLVYKAIQETKRKLNNKTALIGFVGAPLTISFFMLDSKRKKEYKKQNNHALRKFNQ